MWTAKQARELAEESVYKDEIHAIDQVIIDAVVGGNTQTIFYDRISDYVKNRLEKLGYQVTIEKCYATKISW
jgi:hypothetical protein